MMCFSVPCNTCVSVFVFVAAGGPCVAYFLTLGSGTYGVYFVTTGAGGAYFVTAGAGGLTL